VFLTGCIQRIRANPGGIAFQAHNLCPQQSGGMAKPGIGQIFGQDHRRGVFQQGLQHQHNRVLPAMGQHDIFGFKRANFGAAQPVENGRARFGFGFLAGIFNQAAIGHLRHALITGADQVS